MKRDEEERIEHNTQVLKDAQLDALVCALPMNVLLLLDYWSIIGASFAVQTREGNVTLLVPEDEPELAADGLADEIKTFSAGSLTELKNIREAVRKPLAEIAEKLKVNRVGFGF